MSNLIPILPCPWPCEAGAPLPSPIGEGWQGSKPKIGAKNRIALACYVCSAA
jgi:hypothetical protein